MASIKFDMSKSSCKVCVTGGAGYIGSWLIRKLLERGYIVHATLRNLNDECKVGVLKRVAGSESGLVLFEADIYKGGEFEKAIEGCEYVFHVATPMQHSEGYEHKDTSEAAVAGARSILGCCARAGTVKKLVYTASVMAASPLQQDGSGAYKEFIDESCWTPLHHSFHYAYQYASEYTRSKTLAEREILSERDIGNLQVVSLACGLVGGDTLLPYIPSSVGVLISPIWANNQAITYRALKLVEEINGKLPIVHIDDVCEAHIFCIDNLSITKGRYLCASSFVSSAEVDDYYHKNYPDLYIKLDDRCSDNEPRQVKWGSTKLEDKGFKYKYDWKMILDDSVKCLKRLGEKL